MVKRLKLNCKFKNGTSSQIDFYVGESAKDSHPIQFQHEWLNKEYGGKVGDEIMKSLQDLKNISEKNRVSFEELCDYVFSEVNAAKEITQERARCVKQSQVVAKIDNVKSTSFENEEKPTAENEQK